jgi:hypothetical protein
MARIDHCRSFTQATVVGTNAGYAMIGVLVFIAITLAVMTAAFDRLHQISTFEAAEKRIPASENGVSQALGISLSRLQTGEPPNDDYTCRLRLRSSDGSSTALFLVTYTRLAADQWQVEAEPSTAPADVCPLSFSATCALVLP